MQTLVEDLRGRSALFTQCWTEHAVVDRTGDIVFHDQPIAQVPRDVRNLLSFGRGAWPGMLERPAYSVAMRHSLRRTARYSSSAFA